MIVGIGTDLVEIKRIQRAVQRNQKFPQRVLTQREQESYRKLMTSKRQMEYLSGRWAAKEAFAKAFGTGIGKALKFQDMEIRTDEYGAPVLTTSVTKHFVHLSITHTDHYAQAFVVIESRMD